MIFALLQCTRLSLETRLEAAIRSHAYIQHRFSLQCSRTYYRHSYTHDTLVLSPYLRSGVQAAIDRHVGQQQPLWRKSVCYTNCALPHAYIGKSIEIPTNDTGRTKDTKHTFGESRSEQNYSVSCHCWNNIGRSIAVLV